MVACEPACAPALPALPATATAAAQASAATRRANLVCTGASLLLCRIRGQCVGCGVDRECVRERQIERAPPEQFAEDRQVLGLIGCDPRQGLFEGAALHAVDGAEVRAE